MSEPSPARSSNRSSLPVLVAAVLTATPSLLSHTEPPSNLMLVQLLAFASWGGVVLAIAPGRVSMRTWPLQAALLIIAASALWSWGPGSLPSSYALVSLAMLAAAMLVAWAGGEAARQDSAVSVFAAVAWGILLAGLINATVAFVQVFAPSLTHGGPIEQSHLIGRAVGNMRQPNHLCSLLLWGVVAAVALHELRQLRLKWAVAAVTLMIVAVELSASRTGAIGLLLLAAWGMLGKRLSRHTRILLVTTLAIYLIAYLALLGWSEWTQQAVGAQARQTQAAPAIDSPNSRQRIWANTVEMIVDQPWTGVGFGEFNLAWSLSAFDQRPIVVFDHAHNLLLQLAVELGLPLAGVVLGLLVLALLRAVRASRAWRGDRSVAAGAATMLVLLIGLHSMLEYPLWYGYFLLPTAFAWGFSLGSSVEPTLPARESLAGALAGASIVVGTGLAYLDYQRVTPIYGSQQLQVPLADRVKAGQRSVLFAFYADYAAAMASELGLDTASTFDLAVHVALDDRLMIAWARHLAANGQIDLARTLAQRLREFQSGRPEVVEFFARCRSPSPADFQCQPPQVQHSWREFVRR